MARFSGHLNETKVAARFNRMTKIVQLPLVPKIPTQFIRRPSGQIDISDGMGLRSCGFALYPRPDNNGEYVGRPKGDQGNRPIGCATHHLGYELHNRCGVLPSIDHASAALERRENARQESEGANDEGSSVAFWGHRAISAPSPLREYSQRGFCAEIRPAQKVGSVNVILCKAAEGAENPFDTIAYGISEHKLSSAIHVAAATLPQGPGWDREEIVR